MSTRGTSTCMAAEPPSDDIDARIAFLRQRESELKQVVQEETRAADSGVMLRLPENVVAGQAYTAVLPSGVKVRFMAPAGAVAGQLVRVKAPDAAQQALDVDVGDEDDEEEEEEEEDDEDEDEEDDDDDETLIETTVTADADEKAAAEAVESVGAAVSDPKSEAAATAIKQGDVGKALLTSIFGESKADRAKRESAEAAAASVAAEQATENLRMEVIKAEEAKVAAMEANAAAKAAAEATAAEREAAQLRAAKATMADAEAKAVAIAAAAEKADAEKDATDKVAADEAATKEAADKVAAEAAAVERAAQTAEQLQEAERKVTELFYAARTAAAKLDGKDK